MCSTTLYSILYMCNRLVQAFGADPLPTESTSKHDNEEKETTSKKQDGLIVEYKFFCKVRGAPWSIASSNFLNSAKKPARKAPLPQNAELHCGVGGCYEWLFSSWSSALWWQLQKKILYT
ncbi:hypothetical protein XELAEV_18012473mg [Xenopus laevis]|uniref:Uncharacterized protein n=1 Tax=Xenopus laevis TaxID=8355 RepID=A0A974DMP2_XENLA|nr:hypothetical protein XELAEV_18012473mg [Xenopus laevis]